jgi:hypothetical protein
MDLNKVTDRELIQELESRGYTTDLLFSIEDVKLQLDSYNGDNENENDVTLDEDDMSDIIDSLTFDVTIGNVNDQIYEKITEFFENY